MEKETDTKDVIFMINQQDSDNKCKDLSNISLVKEYSSFVFLISMKYLKNEEKSKQAAIKILKKLHTKMYELNTANIKHWLYNETLMFCNA